MSTRICFLFASALIAAAPVVRAGSVMTIWADSEDQESKVEKEQDSYDQGTDALDDHDWSRAIRYFDKVISMKMAHAPAALYFKAYAQAQLGNRSEAVATLVDLQQAYPKSKWTDDAKKLELEIRQRGGQTIDTSRVDDEELKLMALNGLMQSDPERALPIVESVLNSNQPAKVKEKALFVLSQSSSPKAAEILARIAKSGPVELQGRAIRFLGIAGGSRSREVLADVYNTSSSIDVKKSVLKAYMISGDRAHLLSLAKGETNPELRAEAVTQLGVSGARDELADLYSVEPTMEVKKKILQAMFIGGNGEKLDEIARTEKNLDLKLTAVRNLGLMGGGRTGSALVQIYQSDARTEVREQVINALFIQGNAKALVELARSEKNKELKSAIVQKLSLMHSKEGTDYLLELLKE